MPHPALRHRPAKPRFDHGTPISAIDTRPLVFVALFVTVLFLLAASERQVHALLVDLPQGFERPPDFALPYMVVDVSQRGELSLDGKPVPLAGLTQAIRASAADWPIVLLRADPDTAYDIVAHVLDRISEAGVASRDICFDPGQLGAFRRFDKIAFIPALTLIEPENPSWADAPPSFDLPPSGCEQFIVPMPVT